MVKIIGGLSVQALGLSLIVILENAQIGEIAK